MDSKWGDCLGPHDPALVVELLYQDAHRPRDADPVAAHDGVNFFVMFSGDRDVKRFGIFLP